MCRRLLSGITNIKQNNKVFKKMSFKFTVLHKNKHLKIK